MLIAVYSSYELIKRALTCSFTEKIAETAGMSHLKALANCELKSKTFLHMMGQQLKYVHVCALTTQRLVSTYVIGLMCTLPCTHHHMHDSLCKGGILKHQILATKLQLS